MGLAHRHVRPGIRYFFPNFLHTRADYLKSLTDAGCEIVEARDLALDGTPYGDTSEEAIRAKDCPPLALIVLARKLATSA